MKKPAETTFNNLVCPLPLAHKDRIVISHGSGGRMTKDLIDTVFARSFSNPTLAKGNDFADLLLPNDNQHRKLIISTDAHIVNPIFFPGGDIGRLAVSGTVNDVSMSGGEPLYLTASFIIEEGFPIADLTKIVESMRQTADEAGVLIVAGDTKVTEKGKTDKIFISTTGIGLAPADKDIGGQCAQPGDSVIISGSIGDHGIAVLAARNELGFRTTIQSDVAPLNKLIKSVAESTTDIHVLRDPTRGGLATTLNEIALQSQVSIQLIEKDIPVKPEVKGACEMLGFDPLYVANEGKVILILPENQAQKALQALRAHPLGKDSIIIGKVIEPAGTPRVTMKTAIGGTRIVDMLTGEMLPRIC
ncbi:MAG: hydrogenase expression/formation protein HypE [Pelolinea sp.]|nr:hydrogenase expression/formation protein HypE [Pelolinea sp.]